MSKSPCRMNLVPHPIVSASFKSNGSRWKILLQTNSTIDINEKSTNKTIRQKIITQPKAMVIEDPYLYRVTPVVKSNDKIIDTDKKRFGIRKIDVTARFFSKWKTCKI